MLSLTSALVPLLLPCSTHPDGKCQPYRFLKRSLLVLQRCGRLSEGLEQTWGYEADSGTEGGPVLGCPILGCHGLPPLMLLLSLGPFSPCLSAFFPGAKLLTHAREVQPYSLIPSPWQGLMAGSEGHDRHSHMQGLTCGSGNTVLLCHCCYLFFFGFPVLSGSCVVQGSPVYT